MQNRRDFLKNSSLIALTPTVPGFLAKCAYRTTPVPNDRALVVIQMDGGNDGVNTLVPFTDEGYAKHRKELFIPEDRLLKINKEFGLNPAMRGMADLWEDSKLAIVPAVGYPNPNRSHEASMAIWQTCQFNQLQQKSYGWLGRVLDASVAKQAQYPDSIFVGDRQPPIALQGRKCVASSLQNLDDYRLPDELSRATVAEVAKTSDASSSGSADPEAPNSSESGYGKLETDLASFLERTDVNAFRMSKRVSEIAGADSTARYPQSRLADNLKTIAQLLKAGFGTRVFYTIQSGYDTHAGQNRDHGSLLFALSSSVKAFHDDLQESKLDDRVLLLCFSEFGRRVDENGSAGTDHGVAGLTMLAGTPVRGGVHGEFPGLTELDDGGLKTATDFRSIYQTITSRWLGFDGSTLLKQRHPELNLFSAL